MFPDSATLLSSKGVRASLVRVPVSPPAKALVVVVAAMALPYRAAKRPLGPKALPGWEADVGAVLADILQAYFSPGGANPSRWRQSPDDGLWKAAPLGFKRASGLLDALWKAGLVGREDKLQVGGLAAPGRPVQWATATWPTPALLALAEEMGVTPATRDRDWAPEPSQLAAVNAKAGDTVVIKGALCQPPPDLLGLLRAEVDLIHAALAGTRIAGAGPTVAFSRRFSRTLDFGGRLYALGGGYQSLKGPERLGITFDGEPCAEVDIKASQLTVTMGLAGFASAVDGDPYRPTESLGRAALKAWTVQSLGRGRIDWTRWGDDTAPEVRTHRPAVIRAEMVARFPFLASLAALVPPAVLGKVPEEDRAWAIGQWIVAQEAGAMVGALVACLKAGIPALPVHDSLIVPQSGVSEVQAALWGSFREGVGIAPRMEVEARA